MPPNHGILPKLDHPLPRHIEAPPSIKDHPVRTIEPPLSIKVPLNPAKAPPTIGVPLRPIDPPPNIRAPLRPGDPPPAMRAPHRATEPPPNTRVPPPRNRGRQVVIAVLVPLLLRQIVTGGDTDAHAPHPSRRSTMGPTPTTPMIPASTSSPLRSTMMH